MRRTEFPTNGCYSESSSDEYIHKFQNYVVQVDRSRLCCFVFQLLRGGMRAPHLHLRWWGFSRMHVTSRARMLGVIDE